jgi:GR25 family glycosyltransferase involved in LPS biosynthesis
MKLEDVFVISLPSDLARRKNILAACERAGLGAKIFDAFQPKKSKCLDSPQDLLAGRFLASLTAARAPGTYGCSMSHALLWKSLQNKVHLPDGVGLIMEDDVSLAPEFLVQLSNVLAELPRHFDFCFLGGWPSDPRFRMGQPRVSSSLALMKHFCLTSTAIYLINYMRLPNICSRILPMLDEVDVHIASFRQELNIFLYAGAYPCCLTQVEGSSSRLNFDKSA